MGTKVVAYGLLDDKHKGVYFHFLSDGKILVKDDDMPCGHYEFYQGLPKVLDHLHVVDQEKFLEFFGAWDD